MLYVFSIYSTGSNFIFNLLFTLISSPHSSFTLLYLSMEYSSGLGLKISYTLFVTMQAPRPDIAIILYFPVGMSTPTSYVPAVKVLSFDLSVSASSWAFFCASSASFAFCSAYSCSYCFFHSSHSFSLLFSQSSLVVSLIGAKIANI